MNPPSISTTETMLRNLDAQASALPVPGNYFKGCEPEWEWGIKNVLVFARTDRENLQRKTIESNQHHRHVLLCCLRTEGVVGIDQRPVALRPGQGVLLLPYQYHHYYRLGAGRICWVFVTFEATGAGIYEGFRCQRLVFGPEELILLRHIMDCSAAQRTEGRARLLVDGLQLLLGKFHQRLQRRSGRPPARSRVEGTWVERVQSAITRDKGAVRSIQSLAPRLGISEGRLRAVFRKQTGESLGIFLRHQRLHRALEAMRNPRLALYEVAESCGYSSCAAFSRSFKSLVGMTPRDYRKSISARW